MEAVQLIRNQQVESSSLFTSFIKETPFVYRDKRGFLYTFFAVVIEDKEIDNSRFGEEGSSNEKVV